MNIVHSAESPLSARTMAPGPPILDHLALLTDATRSRLLVLLERQELTVSELCAVLQAPQSTISRQLKTLGNHGWLTRRPEGPRAFYSMELASLGPTERRMWLLLRDQVSATQSAQEDEARLESVLRERHSARRSFSPRPRKNGTRCGASCSARASIRSRCWGCSTRGGRSEISDAGREQCAQRWHRLSSV